MRKLQYPDPRQFEYFVITIRNIYQVVDLAEGSGGGRHTLESRRFSCGAGIEESGFFKFTCWKTDLALSWHCQGEFHEPISAIKIVLTPIPDGYVTGANQWKRILAEGEIFDSAVQPGAFNVLQALLVENPDGSALFIDLFEAPPRKKPLIVEKIDGRLKLSIILEELACQRKCEFQSPTFAFRQVANWQEAAHRICASVERDFKVVPFKKRTDLPAWAKQISLVVNLDGKGYFHEQDHDFPQATKRLYNLAERFPPEKTLICMAGFMGRFDHSSANFDPAQELGGVEGFRELMRVAHRLGFHIMILGNVHGIGSDLAEKHPELLREAQQRLASGETHGWFIDWNRDLTAEWVIHYISLNDERWRRILISGIGSLLDKYDIDGFFLDQTNMCPNDPSHDHNSGLCDLIGELHSRYPRMLFAGESMKDYLLPLTPFATEHPPLPPLDNYHPLMDYIFNRYVRRFMHLVIFSPDNKWGGYPFGVCVKPVSMEDDKSMPEEKTRNWKYDARCFDHGIVPTLMLSNWTVDLNSPAVGEIFDFARRYSG